MRSKMVEIPIEVFDAIAGAEDPTPVVEGLVPAGKVRQDFARHLWNTVVHTVARNLGLDGPSYEAIIGLPFQDLPWEGNFRVDDSPSTLKKLCSAHLLSAYGGRILRSNERLRSRIENAAPSDMTGAIACLLPSRTPPSIAALRELAALATAPAPEAHVALYGTLHPFLETGTEGVVWSLIFDHAVGYASYFDIKTGDHLEAYDSDGSVIWAGMVKLEYERCICGEGDRVQQMIRGTWVHGLNDAQEPEAWADLFFSARRARLVRPAGLDRICGHVVHL